MDNLQTLALLSIDELTARASEAPRQLSLCMTQLVQAKKMALAGDKNLSKQHVEAAKRFYLRAQEDEHGQDRRVAHVQAVVEEKGAALDSSKGKDVVRLKAGRAGATWLNSWTGNR